MARTRTIVSSLSISAVALVALVMSEGYTDRAIIPVKGDKPTIGFGTTGGVHMGDATTPHKALARSLRDIQKYEGALKQCVSVPLHQYEYDAYIDFSYNVGSANFCGSTMVKKLNMGDYDGACREILRWTYYQGKNCADPKYSRLCGGLVIRRQTEYKTCIGELNDTHMGD